MEIVPFLETNGLAGLTNIKINRLEDLDVYILNYEQIPSDPKGLGKYHPVLCECRNLVVRDKPWRVMSRSFRRFFNWGEDVQATQDFIAAMKDKKVIAHEKFDGSLITVVFFDNRWNIFTRGSNADTNPFRGMSYNSFTTTFGEKVRSLLDLSILDPKITYIFELCTPGANVTKYSESFLALLAARESTNELDIFELKLPDTIHRPETFKPSSIDEVHERISKKSPDFEGYVLSYSQNNEVKRIKVKSKSYVELHHLHSKAYSFEDLVGVCLTGEIAEVSLIIPDLKDTLEKIDNDLSLAIRDCDSFIAENKLLSRKEFAMKVGKRPFAFVLYDVFQGKYPNAHTAFTLPTNRSKIANQIQAKA